VLLDISQPVTVRTATWPGDEPFSCGWTMALGKDGSGVNVGWARTSPHVGTHVDAPFHYDDAGPRVGGLDLDAFVGECVVVDAVGAGELDARLLPDDLPPRVLLRTTTRDEPGEFRREFPVLTREAIAELAAARVKLVGVDAPSVDAFDSRGLPLHHALYAAGIVNVENLALARVEPGRYRFYGAPVRWVDMDAAPLRALLQR